MITEPRDLPGLVGIPLSDEQLSAATAPLGPQLIVAGAGTGKTTVMAARVVWLVATGAVQAHQVLGLTFTNKAASELRQRIDAALARLPGAYRDDGDSPTVATYHAFAGTLLGEFGALLGVEQDCRLLMDAQRSRLAYSVACHPVSLQGVAGSPTRVAQQILTLDDSLADLDIDTDDLRGFDDDLGVRLAGSSGPGRLLAALRQAAADRSAMSRLVEQFRESKLDGELLDFADQVRLASRLSRQVPFVAQSLRRRFGVVLLDEYQDTSRGQRRMLQALFAGHPVTAVGDPCQAIYGWRGASVTNIDQFPAQFAGGDVEPGSTTTVSTLTINRRSGEAVLQAANAVSAELRTFHRHVGALRPPADAPDASVRCALLRTWDEELAWVGRQIADQAQCGADWSDIAVLCRSNDQVAAIAAHLAELGAPVRVLARQNLMALPEVAAVTGLVRVMVDPFANPELLAQLVGPRWRIGPRDLAILASRAVELANPDGSLDRQDVEVSLLDAVHDPGPDDRFGYSTEARERFAGFVAELHHLDRFRDRPVVEVVEAIIEALGPSVLVGPSDSMPDSLNQLIGLAEGFRSLRGGRGLAEFSAYLADCARFDTPPQVQAEPSGPGVTVMTIHAAKGLEFPIVVLPFLAATVFPDTQGTSRWPTSSSAVPPVAADEPDPALTLGFPGREFTTKDHDQYLALARQDERRDEDRLAYVAVTRARTLLIASGHWWGPTQTRPRGPSDYLLAIRSAGHADQAVDEWVTEPGDPPEPDAELGESMAWPGVVVSPSAQQLAHAISDHEEPVDPADPAAPVDRWQSLLDDLVATRTDHEGALAGPQVWSTSEFVAAVSDPAAFRHRFHRPMPRRPSRAAARGTNFHSWIESRLGQQALFGLGEVNGTLSDRLPGDQARDFEDLFGRTEFADREPFALEQPFVLSVGGMAITGRIDAVFPVMDTPGFDWEVVDWKTGDPGKADPLQLAVYRGAWARIVVCPVERVRGSFVFLADGTHRTFDDLPPIAELTTRLARLSAAPVG